MINDIFMQRFSCFETYGEDPKRPTCYECKLFELCDVDDCNSTTKLCTNNEIVYRFFLKVILKPRTSFDNSCYGDRLNIIDYNNWTDCYNDLEPDDF